MKKALSLVVVSGLALAAPAMAQNGLFDIGNLLVSQAGDGTAALGSAATVCSIREMTTAGAFTNDNALMPTVVNGLQRRLTMSGSATSEGFLTFTADKKAVSFQGYDASPGLASVATTTSAAVNRVVGRIDLAMNIDTGTAFTDAHSGNNIRSSYIAGSTAYSGGAGNGVRSGPFGFVGPTTAESGTLTNARVINSFAGQLFSSSAAGAFVGINSLSGGVATNVFGSVSGTGTPSPYDFIFASATVCYVADDRTVANGGGLQKWTFSGSSWSLAYTMTTNLTAGLRALTMDPATGTFYAISADTQSKLVAVIDGGSAATSPFSTLYQSTTNTNLRGVEFIAAPAPGSVALLGLGGLLAARRRRNS